MHIQEWFDRRRRMRSEAQDEAIYMLRDHGVAAELEIEHELSKVPTPCQRRTMLKMAKSRVTKLRRQRQLRTHRAG
ncbi:hypothetical protein [Sphingomonas oryzagri]